MSTRKARKEVTRREMLKGVAGVLAAGASLPSLGVVSSSVNSARARGMLLAAKSFYVGGKKLPYNRRLAWISNPDTQWFDTGVKLDFEDTLKVVVAYPRANSTGINDVVSTGNRSSSSSSIGILIGGSYSKCYGYARNGVRRLSLALSNSLEDAYVSISDSTTDINGTVYDDPRGDVSRYCNLCFFVTYQGYYSVGCKIKEVEIVGKHLWFPVMGNDGKVHMYDSVTGSFLDNKGTGEFVYGEL